MSWSVAAFGGADLDLATTNVGHLGRIAPADLSQNIAA